ERPMPGLRHRLNGLADGMTCLGIECLVFLRGVEVTEIASLAKALGAPAAADRAFARDRVQASLRHVLVRFVELKKTGDDDRGSSASAALIEPQVHELLGRVADSITRGASVDVEMVRTVADRILSCVTARTYSISLHSYGPGADFEAGHAANVAMMTAA